MTDQKRAGRSRAAQRQYLRGVDQKRGAADMMAVQEILAEVADAARGRVVLN
jgi:hypothetical protein